MSFDEDDDELIKIRFEHSVHEVHEGCWSICDAKRHDKKLIVPVLGSEGSLFYAFRVDF